MPDQFPFSQHLQDSLLILGIEEDEFCGYLCAYVKPEHFLSEPSRAIFSMIKKFYTTYSCAPKEHLSDLLSEYLKPLTPEQRDILIIYTHKIYEVTPNTQYVLSNLKQFIQHTSIINGIIDGSKHIERGEYIEAQNVITEAFRAGINIGDEGIDYLKDIYLRARPDEILFHTHIDALDKTIGGGIRVPELIVWLAATNLGKTWALTYCTKEALSQGKKVLYYTLEMTPEWTATRIDMGFGAYSLYGGSYRMPHTGNIVDAPSVYTVDRRELLRFIEGMGGQLFIKGTPRGGLTVSKIEADLERLEATKDFIPDLLVIDYADLMGFETGYSDLRHNLAALYTKLRELAVLRNISVITASQSNRSSYDARIVSLKHFAEDIQKAMIADLVISLCQTVPERNQNKMRLFVCKNRNGPKGVQIENYYSYEIGQFSLASQIYVEEGKDEEEE